MERLLRISEYAKECGVSTTIIRKRLAKGEIKASNKKGLLCTKIDINKYPSEGAKRAGRRYD